MVTAIWNIHCTFLLTQNQAVIASVLWSTPPLYFQPPWTNTHLGPSADLTLWIIVTRKHRIRCKAHELK